MANIKTIAGLTLAGLLALGACTPNSPTAGNGGTSGAAGTSSPLKVTIKDDTCEVSAASTGSGTVNFELQNNGTVRNEFEILAEDKLRIVGERENLGPGTTTSYTLTLEPGTYYTACKKNMVGSLVGTAKFTVTDSGQKIQLAADEAKAQKTAVNNYTAYIRDQAGQLLEKTKEFAAAYTSGNVEEAKHLYPLARMHYERIEPTAEAFGDLDPALDEREADYQEADDKGTREWTGWHVIEKDLWRPADFSGLDEANRQKMITGLVDNTQKLYDAVYASDFKVTLADISNGAIGLLEEVATSKITGEEEAFSHTDLYDFKANLEGAEVAYGNVEVLAKKKNPELAKEISKRIADLNALLTQYKEGEGYRSYDKLDDTARKELSNGVNALRLPLAKLTEAILK